MGGVDLLDLHRATLARLSGERLTRETLAGLQVRSPVSVLGLGKAARGMARGAAQTVGTIAGLVATHAQGPAVPGVRVALGGHPLPDAASEAAGRLLLREAERASVAETVLFLVGGGGSAIAAVPAAGLTLEDKIGATRALLRGGTPIEQTNAVRRHLSALKGGRLGAATRARRRIALVLCDVPSGELASVASGPTAADPTTFADCLEIARRVSLPERVVAHLEAGARGERPETIKPGDPRVSGIEHVLLAAPGDLATTAAGLAGEPCETGSVTGRVEEVAERIVARVRAGPGLLALSGEPTLIVPAGAGRGGRMQHLALLLARDLAGVAFEAVCAGSDGRDGATEHAGARVDGATASQGVDLAGAIARFDSATACAALGAAIPAFDSGTNLCDLVLVRRR